MASKRSRIGKTLLQWVGQWALSKVLDTLKDKVKVRVKNDDVSVKKFLDFAKKKSRVVNVEEDVSDPFSEA